MRSKQNRDVNLSVANMITGSMNQKHLKNKYYANINVDLMIKNVTQIKSGIKINVSINSSACTYKNGKILGSIMVDSISEKICYNKKCYNKNYSNKNVFSKNYPNKF